MPVVCRRDLAWTRYGNSEGFSRLKRTSRWAACVCFAPGHDWRKIWPSVAWLLSGGDEMNLQGNYAMHAELVVACLPIAFVFRPKKGAAGAYVIATIQSSQAV